MKTSPEINELAGALAKAQAALEAAGRDHKAKVETKSGGTYEFNYADFAAYLDVCRKPLGDNGLSFVQEAVHVTGEVSVVTRLMHTTGQWIETEALKLTLIADSRGAITAQIVGSGITYAKRYSLSSLIGLASESDDDGNAASGNSAETGRREGLPDCPACKTNKHVIIGKAEYGGGFVCFGKKGGCGAKWQAGDESRPMRGDGFSPHSDERNEAGDLPAKTNGTKSKAADVANQHNLKTGADIEKENTSFDQWGSLLLKCRPESHQASVNTLLKAIGDGRLSADHVVKILTRCLDRVENPAQLKSVEDAIKPLCEAANVSETNFVMFGELVPQVEDRLSAAATN